MLFVPQAVVALNLHGDSPLKTLVLALNWPPIAFLDWYACAFKNGNTDQMLGPWLLVVPAYWAVVGFAVGLGFHVVLNRKGRHIGTLL